MDGSRYLDAKESNKCVEQKLKNSPIMARRIFLTYFLSVILSVSCQTGKLYKLVVGQHFLLFSKRDTFLTKQAV